MGISERRKLVLKQRGLSIKEVSESCEIPYRTLQNYLRGEREPNAKALAILGTQLGISLDWLLTGSGPMARGGTPETAREAEPSGTYVTNPKERALLELFKELSEEDQREICRDAEEKKRMSDIEAQLKEVQAKLAALKNTG